MAMVLKKKPDGKNTFSVHGRAVIQMRGNVWHFRMWLHNDKKYVRLSLATKNFDIAFERAERKVFELSAMESYGKKYFSETAKEAVESYLEHRKEEVPREGGISAGRWGTIKAHLSHWLDFIGEDKKIANLEFTDCETYSDFRLSHKNGTPASLSTIRNEQATINAMCGWLYRYERLRFPKFYFRPLKKEDTGDERLRRSVLSDSELSAFREVLDNRILAANGRTHEPEIFKKVLLSYYFLVALVTGLRSGEQQKLKWKNSTFETHLLASPDDDYRRGGSDVKPGTVDTDVAELTRISVEAKTSKTGKSRTFLVEDSEIFQGLFKLAYSEHRRRLKVGQEIPPFGDCLVFTPDFIRGLNNSDTSREFHKILEAAEIKGSRNRNLTPYSLRHNFITQKINQGYAPFVVAKMCGTSASHVEKTYYHLSDKKMIENAMPGYELQDGVLVRVKN